MSSFYFSKLLKTYFRLHDSSLILREGHNNTISRSLSVSSNVGIAENKIVQTPCVYPNSYETFENINDYVTVTHRST